MKLLRKLFNAIRTTHTVTVLWEGEYITHKATSLSDALSWLACYPVGSKGAVTRNLNGMIVAMRR